jgi:thiamine-monophosphate kinase
MVQSLSEKALLERISRIAQVKCGELRVGIGDDCAVLRRISGKEILLSTDLLLEGIHFRLDWTSAFLLGYKALAVNVSDIAAMGGRPLMYLVSLALPSEYSSPAFVDELYRGMEQAGREYRIALAGGDLSRSASGVVISITIVGIATVSRAALRSGARPGDQICVCGPLGLSAIGLELLTAGNKAPLKQIQKELIRGETTAARTVSEWRKRCILAHLAPKSPLLQAMQLSRGRLVSAMMDISDGLSIDLQRLCEASGVGAVVFPSQLPICPVPILEEKRQEECALHGGEDYALLFTVPPRKMAPLNRLIERNRHMPIARIGEITQQPGICLQEGSARTPLQALGYDHFSTKSASGRISSSLPGRITR